MNVEEQARDLFAKAAATEDTDELNAILAQLRALLRESHAHIEDMIRERRR